MTDENQELNEEHGSERAYQRHLRQGQDTCVSCREAHNRYVSAYRSEHQHVTVMANARGRARYQAYARLRALYPELWDLLYEEELRAYTPRGKGTAR